MTEAHPHDDLFQAVFSSPENALAILGAVLPPDLFAALDTGSLELESSKFVDDELRPAQSDVLFRARFAGHEARVVFLIEHQSTVPPLMPYRLLHYMVRFWERWLREHESSAPRVLPAVIPIVLYHGPKAWSGPRSLADILDLPDRLKAVVGPHVPAFVFLLDDLAAQEEAPIAARRAGLLGRLALLALKVASGGGDLIELFGRMKPLVAQLRALRGPEALVLVLRYTVQVGDEEPRKLLERLDQSLGSEVGEVAAMATTYEQLLAQGELEGRLKLVTKLLGAILGKDAMTDALMERLRLCTSDQLDSVAALLVSSKKEDLTSALERLLPERK